MARSLRRWSWMLEEATHRFLVPHSRLGQKQRPLDEYRLHLLMVYHREYTEELVKAGGKNVDFREFEDKVERILDKEVTKTAVSPSKRRALLQNYYAKQLEHVISHDIGESSSTAAGGDDDSVVPLKSTFSLSYKAGESNQERKPRGVLLSGSAVPGTLLCLFRGKVYTPGDFVRSGTYPESFGGNPFIMGRYDGCIIDGEEGDKTKTLGAGPDINHPPQKVQPNCMPLNLSIPPTFPDTLKPHIPNFWNAEKPPRMQENVFMRTVAFVATTHIEEEELFVDYRRKIEGFKPDSKRSDNTSKSHVISDHETRKRWM